VVKAATLIVHADWSVNPKKRWMVLADRLADGTFLAHAPERVGEAHTLITRLKQIAGDNGCTLIGFDFPIGFPQEYARQAGITDFLKFLHGAGHGRWAEFYTPAENAEEIRLERPFYPKKPGKARRDHLLKGLGIQSMQALMRQCERAHDKRRAACPLFWTLGGQQVGKAAICGWREVLAPGLKGEKHNFAIWPFSGRLRDLLHPGAAVVAETYPGEFYHHLGINFSNPVTGRKSGKRDQLARRNNRELLLRFAEAQSIHLDPPLWEEIRDGFGANPNGEDRFDATIGLFGMLNTLNSEGSLSEPESEVVRRIEGWIFGQKWTQ
jgi:hypothetical protein